MEHVMGSVEQHMQYNKNAILDTQSELERIKIAMNDKLDKKDWELESVRGDLKDAEKELEANKNKLFTKEIELENIKKDLQDTRDRLDTEKQSAMKMKVDLQDTKEKLKESQEIQSQLKTAIDEKGRELDEVRKNAEENHKTLQGTIQQLKDKVEGTEQSLQHQLKVNAQLQLQIDTIFSASWPLRLNHLANSGNEVVPVVIRLAQFEKYKKNCGCFNTTGFYTRDKGYKMLLSIYPNGLLASDRNNVTVCIYLMKGEHDDHLSWPVRGTLTIQLLNQLSDSNHSEPAPFLFNSSGSHYHRVMKGTRSTLGLWYGHLIPHKRLSYDADKKCQYLKDDCVFFRVCDFQ